MGGHHCPPDVHTICRPLVMLSTCSLALSRNAAILELRGSADVDVGVECAMGGGGGGGARLGSPAAMGGVK